MIRFLLMMLACLNGLNAAETDERKKIAVTELTWTAPIDDFRDIQDVLGYANAKQLCQGLRSMVTTKLTDTKRFQVIERQDLDRLVNELEFVNDTGLVDPRDLKKNPKWMRMKGINILVLGEVSQFSTNKKGVNFGSNRLGGQTINMTVDLRIVDIETGILLSAKPFSTQVPLKMSSNLGGKDIGFEQGRGETRDKLMRKVADGLTLHMICDIQPIQVLGKRGDEFILSYGQSLLEEGDQVEVFKLGERFEIPGTGLYEREEILVGTLKVTHVQGLISKAVPTGKTSAGSIPTNSVCRMLEKKKGGGILDKFKKR